MKFQQNGTVVAELWCNNFDESLRFYTETLGFDVGQHKEGSTHAYLTLGTSQIMISNYDLKGGWETALFEKPLGRGINFSFFVDNVKNIYEEITSKGVEPHIDLYSIWYWRPDCMANHKEFVVLDPDGYMLRFSERVGSRPKRLDDEDHIYE